MKNANINLNKLTWGLTISDTTEVGDVVILNHDEIMAELPELLRHDAVADAVKSIVLRGIKNFASIELPMVGTGKISIVLDATANTDVLKSALLTPMSPDLFPTRIYQIVKTAGIETAYQLVMYDIPDLYKFRNSGKKSVEALQEFMSKRNINDPALRQKLNGKFDEILRRQIGTIPELADSKPFKDLREMVMSIEDIITLELDDLYNGSRSPFPRKAFPYRHSTARNYVKTAYEEKFSKSDEENFENLSNEVGRLIHIYRDKQMQSFIREM